MQVFPLLPLIANEPLGVGAVVCGVRHRVVADQDAYPDLDAFAAGMRELHALGVPTHPCPDPSYWGDGDPGQCSGLSGAGRE